jgi:hypothetical protein
MQKSTIRYLPQNRYWNLNYQGFTDIPFCTFEGAMHYLLKNTEQDIRTQKAFSRYNNELDLKLVTIAEFGMLEKLIKKQFKGITKKQYGWLVGIIERQRVN